MEVLDDLPRTIHRQCCIDSKVLLFALLPQEEVRECLVARCWGGLARCKYQMYGEIYPAIVAKVAMSSSSILSNTSG